MTKAQREPVFLRFFLFFAVVSFALLIFVGAYSAKITPVDDSNNIFESEWTRQGDGILIDNTGTGKNVGGQNVKLRWGYDPEVVNVPYKQAYMPFFFEHRLQPSITIDPCANTSLQFVSSVANDNIEILWNYQTANPNYSFTDYSENCVLPDWDCNDLCVKDQLVCEEESGQNVCWNTCVSFEQQCVPSIIKCWITKTGAGGDYNDVQACNVSLQLEKDGKGRNAEDVNACRWNEPYFNGTYSQIAKSNWRPLGSLTSCQLERNTQYDFRHSAEIGAGENVVFDVNALFDLSFGRFVFVIPKPEWRSTAQTDFSGGIAYDFNTAKVLTDGNVIPDGEIHASVSTQPAGNLTAWWKLDKNTATVATDYSGNGNNGTWKFGADSNATWFFDQNAGFFDGVDDQVDAGSDLVATGADSVCAWIYPKAWGGGNNGRIIDNGKTLFFVVNTGVLGFSSDGGTTIINSAASSIALNTWQFVCAARNSAGTTNFYVNGAVNGAANQASGTVAAGTTNVFIGNDSGKTRTFDGYIADVKLFGRALLATEIANEFARNSDGNGLVVYYNFNDKNSDGSGIIDQAGFDSNGQLLNGADINAWGLWDTNSLFLDGVDDFVDINAHQDFVFDNNSTYTWIARILKLPGNKDNGIAGKGTIGVSGYTVSITDTNKLAFTDLKNRIEKTSTSAIDLNHWVHVAITYDGLGLLSFYLNGVANGTATVDPVDDATRDLNIGLTDGNYFKGYIEDFKLYNRVLSVADIQKDYNRGMKATYYGQIKDFNSLTNVRNIQWHALFESKQQQLLYNDVNLVSWYRFNDNNAGRTLALDYKGSNNGGQIGDANTAVISSLFDNNSLGLDGTGDYVQIPDSASLDISAALTMSMWIRPARIATQYIVKKAINNSTNGYEMSLATTTSLPFFRLNQQASANTYRANGVTAAPSNNNTWMHLVGTYDGTRVRLFVNGREEANIAGPASITTNTVPLNIGIDSDNSTSPFQGAIDEVMIFNRALSVTEVKTLYAAGLSDLNVSVRTCTDPACATASGWQEFDLGNDKNLNNVKLPLGNYVQYLAELSHYNVNYPVGYAYLNDVNITYNSLPDANVVYPIAGETYNKTVTSTIDLNFSIADFDTNAFDLNIDINYSATNTQGSGTAIVNDTNLATLTCDSNNLATTPKCKYRWNISAIADGTYYILAVVNDDYNSDFSAGASTFILTTVAVGGIPDANVLYPISGQSYNRSAVSTIDINIAVSDTDSTAFDLNIDINYSSSNTEGTGTTIINDANLTTITCDSNDMSTSRQCKYSWNITSITNGNYYILTKVNDASNSDYNAGAATFAITTFSPDANILYPMNGESFNRSAISTIDINIAVSDTDTTAFDMNIDINYSATNTQGSGTAIVDDKNLATLTCDSNNLATARQCKYSWNISSVPNGNYYILTKAIDNTNNSDFNASAATFAITTFGPDVNVLYPMTNEAFKNGDVSTIDINVAVSDNDTNTFDMNIDLNYSSSQTQGTGTPIITDYNLARLTCDSNNLATSRQCKYAWNITAVSDGNYYILARVKDNTSNSDFNSGARDFNVWSGWAKRVKILFNNLAIDENLNDFPVPIKLSSSWFNYSDVTNADGNDIKVTDWNGETLSHEVSDWNTAGYSIIWVKVPQIDLNSNIDYMYMYYGNPSVTTRPATGNVWTNNYAAVYHLSQADGNYLDSTSNRNNSTTVYGNLRDNQEPNSLGRYMRFMPRTNLDGNHIGIPSSDSLNFGTSSFTVMVRLNSYKALTDSDLMRKGSTGTTSWWKIEWGDDTGADSNKINFLINGEGTNSAITYVFAPNGLWHDFWGVRNTTTTQLKIYVDANNVATGASNNNSVSTDWNLAIGSKDTLNDDHYDGNIDEVQLSNAIRSANWIKASHWAMDDNYLIYPSAPDINVAKIDNYPDNAALPVFSYVNDGNLTIDFNVFDADNDRLAVDINYGTSSLQGTGTVLVRDLNLAPGICADQTWNDVPSRCVWDWNISIISDANYYVLIKVNDSAFTDFNAANNSFKVDNTAPTTTGDANHNTWQNFDANIHLTCSDGTGAGCSTTKYRINSGSWTAFDTNLLITTEGTTTLDYNSTDIPGNIETTNTKTIKIDKTKPTTSWDGNHNSWKNFDANIHLTCSDGSGAGCATTKYRLDTNPSNAITYGTWQSFDTNVLITSDGNWAIDFNSTDSANNIGDTNTFNVLLDKTKPKIFVRVPLDGNTVLAKTVSFDVNKIKDSNISIGSISASINGSASSVFNSSTHCTASDGNYACSYTETGIGVGSNTVAVNASDSAANAADANSSTFSFDSGNSAPDANIFVPIIGDVWGIGSNDYNHLIRFDVNDVDSGEYVYADLYYSATAGRFEHLIVNDLNLVAMATNPTVDANCASTNFTTTRACWFDLNVFGWTDGNYYIDINVFDRSDANTAKSSTSVVTIDKNAPSTPVVSAPSNTQAVALTITFSAADAASGIKKYWVRTNGSAWVDNGTSASYAASTSSSENLPATHNYCVKATDNGDNNSSESCVAITFNSASGGEPPTEPPVPPIEPVQPPAEQPPAQPQQPQNGSIGGGTVPAQPKELGFPCSAGSDCITGKCVGGKCGECFSDSECRQTQYCSQGLCLIVTGTCGVAKNHEWVSWQCCQNSDCNRGEYCDLEQHYCFETPKPKLSIRISPQEIIENKPFTIIVSDENSNPVQAVEITIGEKKFQTNENGAIETSMQLGMYRIIAAKQGYKEDMRVVEAKKEIKIEVTQAAKEGDLVEIKAVDATGNSVPEAEITIVLENGQMQKMKTNKYGIAYLQSLKQGKIQVSAMAQGYSTAEKTVNIGQELPIQTIAMIIIIVATVAVMALMIALKRKKPKPKKRWSAK